MGGLVQKTYASMYLAIENSRNARQETQNVLLSGASSGPPNILVEALAEQDSAQTRSRPDLRPACGPPQTYSGDLP